MSIKISNAQQGKMQNVWNSIKLISMQGNITPKEIKNLSIKTDPEI